MNWLKISDEKLALPLTDLREEDYCSAGRMQRNDAAFRKVNNSISVLAELLKGTE